MMIARMNIRNSSIVMRDYVFLADSVAFSAIFMDKTDWSQTVF